jgi:hypothetical protein
LRVVQGVETTLFVRRARIASRDIRRIGVEMSTDIFAKRPPIALRTRQLAANIGLMLALSGWTAPPGLRAGPARLCAVSGGKAAGTREG